MMNVPAFDLKRNYEMLKDDLKDAVNRVLESQRFILGEEVEGFEREVASYLGVSNALGCASGTDALLLSLMALGIREGDEVITTPILFLQLLVWFPGLGPGPSLSISILQPTT